MAIMLWSESKTQISTQTEWASEAITGEVSVMVMTLAASISNSSSILSLYKPMKVKRAKAGLKSLLMPQASRPWRAIQCSKESASTKVKLLGSSKARPGVKAGLRNKSNRKWWILCLMQISALWSQLIIITIQTNSYCLPKLHKSASLFLKKYPRQMIDLKARLY